LVRIGYGVLSDNLEFLTKFRAKLAIGVFVIVDAAFTRPNSRREDTDNIEFLSTDYFLVDWSDVFAS
jgi:hypothetical protein